MGKTFTHSVADFPKLFSLWSPNNVVSPHEVPRKYQALWRCSAGHEFSATGQTVLKSKGEGCAACAGRAVNPGVSDLATVVPDAVDIWDHEVNPLSPSQVAATSSRKYWWRCSLGHPWLASPAKITRGQRCPYCSGRRVLHGFNDAATAFPHLLSWLHPDSPLGLHEVTRGNSNAVLLWRCPLGHSWEKNLYSLAVVGERCPYCSNHRVLEGFNDLACTAPHLLELWDPSNERSPHDVLPGAEEKFTWRCSLGHPWRASAVKVSLGTRCPYCSNRLLLPGFNDLSTVFPSIGEIWSPGNNLSPSQSLAYSDTLVKLLCPLNGTEYLESPRRFMRLGSPCLCASCYRPHSRSAFECSVVEALGALLPSYSPILGDRSLIPPYEVDIYYPELNLAMECNGSYWHSNAVVEKNHKVSPREYHAMKRERCGEVGVKLLFIWEDDWNERREEVLTALEESMGGNSPIHPLFTILEKK